MKAVKRLIILAMACVFLCTQGIAISEADPTVPPLRHILDISISATPNELVQGGDVTLTLVISNTSEFAATNLYLESVTGNHSASLGQLLPGDMQVYTRSYTVSEAELEEGRLSFRLSHDDIIASGGESVDYTIDALISRTEARADIEFTRQLSSAHVAPGATAIITYRVKNTGNVPLENVRVQDELGMFASHAELLNPGETRIFSNSISVDSDMTSEAQIKYTAPSVSDEVHTIELENAYITVVEAGASVGLTLDRQSAAPGDIVNGVVTIAAFGSDITGITVYDDVNNTIIADTLEVKAGETATITCSWPVRNNTDYRVRMEGTDAAGAGITEFSGTAAITIEKEAAETELSVSANAQTPVINRAGSARVSIAIINSGNTAARDVVLSEANLGEIRTFEFVPAGEPTLRSILVDVAEDTSYVFSISYTAPDGSIVTAESAPVEIKIAPDGDDPVDNSGDGKLTDIYEIRDASEYYWMIAAGGLILLVLIVLLIISHDRERRERKLRQELGKHRRSTSGKSRREKTTKNDQ